MTQFPELHVIFQRTFMDVLRRKPKEATFVGFKSYGYTDRGLIVRWPEVSATAIRCTRLPVCV